MAEVKLFTTLSFSQPTLLKGRLENSRLVGWKILKRRLGKNQRRVIKDSKAGYKRLKGRLEKTHRQARKN